MEPMDSYEDRCKMAKMHDKVLKRIDNAYADERHIEVCWLCYACFENRINRIMEKVCKGCTKPARTNNRHVGITTKIECLVRLSKSGYPVLSAEDIDLLHTVKGWCKERNDLIHGLVSLKQYNDADRKFKNLSKRGSKLVKTMYSVGKEVREFYYHASSIPIFDEEVIKKCALKTKCVRD